MINNFRKGANHLISRILFAFIAVCFVGAGAVSFLSDNNTGDVVSFSKTKSISTAQFYASRAKEIEHIQSTNNLNLSEEDIKALNIDKIVLQKMVNSQMLLYLAEIFDFDISDESVIAFVKKMPYFLNEKGEFDLKIFKNAFRNSKAAEDEYLQNLKYDLVRHIVASSFTSAFKPSQLMVDNIIEHLAQTRVFDLVSIDLTKKPANFQERSYSEEELKSYYAGNEALFTEPEKRSFAFIEFNKDYFASKGKIKASETEYKEYYAENKDSFGDKSYKEVKGAIAKIIEKQKLEDAFSEFAKELEDQITKDGNDLQAIAAKYGVKIVSFDKISKENIIKNKNLKITDVADAVFEMVEGEISYPIEDLDHEKLVVLELKLIEAPKKQEFSEIKDKLVDFFRQEEVAEANLAILEKFLKAYPNEVMVKNNLILLDQDRSISRIDIDDKIEPRLFDAVFKTEVGSPSELIRDGKKAYFAFVKEEKIKDGMARKIKKDSESQIINSLKENFLQELIGYLTEKNNMKVNI